MAYEKRPQTSVSQSPRVTSGWPAIAAAMQGFVCLETNLGVRTALVVDALRAAGYKGKVVRAEDFCPLTAEEFRSRISEDLTDHQFLGVLTKKDYADYFDLARIKSFVEENAGKDVLVAGVGAHLFKPAGHLTVYADMTRWECQVRYRNGERVFFKDGAENDTRRNFKRGYFVEWRMADRIKKAV